MCGRRYPRRRCREPNGLFTACGYDRSDVQLRRVPCAGQRNAEGRHDLPLPEDACALRGLSRSPAGLPQVRGQGLVCPASKALALGTLLSGRPSASASDPKRFGKAEPGRERRWVCSRPFRAAECPLPPKRPTSASDPKRTFRWFARWRSGTKRTGDGSTRSAKSRVHDTIRDSLFLTLSPISSA